MSEIDWESLPMSTRVVNRDNELFTAIINGFLARPDLSSGDMAKVLRENGFPGTTQPTVSQVTRHFREMLAYLKDVGEFEYFGKYYVLTEVKEHDMRKAKMA